MFCPKCGNVISEKSKFCMKCGCDIESYYVEAPKKVEEAPSVNPTVINQAPNQAQVNNSANLAPQVQAPVGTDLSRVEAEKKRREEAAQQQITRYKSDETAGRLIKKQKQKARRSFFSILLIIALICGGLYVVTQGYTFRDIVDIVKTKGSSLFTANTIEGVYKQINSEGSDSYQIAVIDSDSITIYWYTETDGTKALYWAGTCEKHSGSGKYSWNSQNYHELTDFALLASTDDIKTITYDKGTISYDVSALGITTTLTLKKTDGINISTIKSTNQGENGNQSIENNAVVKSGDVEEVSKQVDIVAKPTKDGELAVFITNKSNTIIDELEVKVNYIDANSVVIDQASDGHDMILPGYTVVSKMQAPSVEYADFQIESKIELNVHNTYINHSDDVVVTSNPGDGCVMAQVTNNADVSIDEIELDAVLFKGEEVVAITFPVDIYDLGAGQSTTEKIDTFSLKTFDSFEYGTDYDRIEVYINQAHTFSL